MTLPTSASAQLIPDRTLGNENSLVNQTNNLRQEIRGGARRGSAIFHSFREFNVGKNREVFFANPVGVGNIFTRITGNNFSKINGTLGVLGNANLFLINPNGIIFGKGARLDLNGSFVGTTASSVFFDNGLEFSSLTPNVIPNGIVINFPIGFGFGGNSENLPGAIRIEGNGQNLQNQSIVGQLAVGRNPSEGLQVPSQQRMYFIGKKIELDGGIITAEGGSINLTSVEKGKVDLNSDWTLNHDRVLNFGPIQLNNEALIDVSSPDLNSTLTSGSIEIIGKIINFSNNSIALSQNRGSTPGGNIYINAIEKIEFIGVRANNQDSLNEGTAGTIPIELSGVRSETNGNSQARGANIFISSPKVTFESAEITSNTYSEAPSGDIKILGNNIRLFDGTEIRTFTSQTGQSGNIVINASNNLELLGSRNLLNTENINTNTINTLNSSIGKGGNIVISTNNLIIENGSGILTFSFPSPLSNNLNYPSQINGKTGDLTVNAPNITIRGSNFSEGNNPASDPQNTEQVVVNSNIGSLTTNSLDSGNVTIRTETLLVEDEGRIANRSLSTGSPNTLTVNSSNSITVRNGSIISLKERPQQGLIDLGLLPETNTNSSSGILIINTPDLKIDNGTISVANAVEGNAGELVINADRIRIGNSGSITAFSNSGQGGTVRINSRDIQISGSSNIISSSEGTTTNANAGSITISSQKLFLNNSTITTEAREGNGGNITLKVQDLRILDGSRISASVGTTDSDGNPTGGGDGGNININASPGTIVLRDSTINADAVFGSGGNIDITTSTLFSNRPIAEVITATSQFGQQGIVNIEITGTLASNLIQARIPEIAIALPKLENNQCLSPQRSGVEKIDLDRYGSPESPAFQAAPYDVYVLEPQYRDPNAPLRSRDIIEPHVIGTRTDGSKFLGTLCFTKNQEE